MTPLIRIKPINLLDLPGELRNHIYNVATKGVAPTVNLRSPYLDYSDEDEVPLDPHVSRPLLGLTQTCRQLRSEFLSIYFRTLDVYLDHSVVYDYLATFIWQGRLNEGPQFADFNICLANDIQTRYGHTENTFQRMNIAHLLRLYKTMPGFDLGFIDSTGRSITSVLEKAMMRGNKKWWKGKGDRWTELHFLIKPEESDWWMKPDMSKAQNRHLVDEKMVWAARFGFLSGVQFEVGVDKGMNSDEGEWLEKLFQGRVLGYSM